VHPSGDLPLSSDSVLALLLFRKHVHMQRPCVFASNVCNRRTLVVQPAKVDPHRPGIAHLKVRRGGRIVPVAVIIVISVNTDDRIS
jgi:hypothetical protein